MWVIRSCNSLRHSLHNPGKLKNCFFKNKKFSSTLVSQQEKSNSFPTDQLFFQNFSRYLFFQDIYLFAKKLDINWQTCHFLPPSTLAALLVSLRSNNKIPRANFCKRLTLFYHLINGYSFCIFPGSHIINFEID